MEYMLVCDPLSDSDIIKHSCDNKLCDNMLISQAWDWFPLTHKLQSRLLYELTCKSISTISDFETCASTEINNQGFEKSNLSRWWYSWTPPLVVSMNLNQCLLCRHPLLPWMVTLAWPPGEIKSSIFVFMSLFGSVPSNFKSANSFSQLHWGISL